MKRLLSLFSVIFVLAATLGAQIAPNVIRTKISGVDVLIYKTGVANVVTLRGAFPGGDAFAGEGNLAVPTLCGMLLDQGTTKQDKFAIAEQLERVGATIDFSVSQQEVSVSAKCLKKDVALVIGLIAEQLRTPAFSAEEFEKAKAQFAGNLQRSLESTDYRAGDAFDRAVFPPGHPNYSAPAADVLAAIKTATLDDVKAFHAKHYGPAHFTLVLVGDVDPAAITAAATTAFAGWTGGVDYIHPPKAGAVDAQREQSVFMADKTSVSIVLGQASGLRYSDPDYQALRTATAILGSGFTGRLMANVRDKEGLTYGIGSRLADDTFSDGAWRITATFAPAKLEQGITSTKRQLKLWYDSGVTEQELADRKTDLIGTYKVGLATTDGMAGQLLVTVNRDLPLTWMDDYPKQISALSTQQVNAAIKKHVKPDDLVLIKAGTVPGAVEK